MGILQKRRLASILLLAAVSFGVYLNSLNGQYLIDDHLGILENSQVHDARLYFTEYFRLSPGSLTQLCRAFLWQLGAGRTFAFHLFSVFGHVIFVILFFLFLDMLFKDPRLAFLSALIFAVHPIHTEAVSWISAGPYVFSSCFFIASFIFYLKSQRSLANLFVCVFLFAAGFLFGGNAVAMLPAVVFIYEIFFRSGQEGDNRSVRIVKLVVLVLCLFATVSLCISFFSIRDKFMHTIFAFKGPRYLVVVAKAFAYYLRIIYLPLRRGLYHPFAYNTTETDKLTPAFFASLAIIALGIYLFFRLRKKQKAISFGIAWFFLAYLPYSNIVPVCNIISERYMYLASAGICLIIASCFLIAWNTVNKNEKYRRFLRIALMVAFALFIISYAALTVDHNCDFSDIISFWESNINNFPDGYMAYNNLAGTFYVMGEKQQAKAYCWVSLMINYQQPHVWCNLGKVYFEEGDLKMAEFCYAQALKIDKVFLPARQGLRLIESKTGSDNKNGVR